MKYFDSMYSLVSFSPKLLIQSGLGGRIFFRPRVTLIKITSHSND